MTYVLKLINKDRWRSELRNIIECRQLTKDF
jgi:hypothetical protein